MVVVMEISLWRIFAVLAEAGHTTLVIDDVAADYEMRELLGVGLHDKIEIKKLES